MRLRKLLTVLLSVGVAGVSVMVTVAAENSDRLNDQIRITARAASPDGVYRDGGHRQFYTDVTNAAAHQPFRGRLVLRLKESLTHAVAGEVAQTAELTGDQAVTLTWELPDLPPAVYLVEVWAEQEGRQGLCANSRIVLHADVILPPDSPDDFDAFWRDTLAAQAAIPLDLQITKVKDVEASELYKFSFAGLLGYRCYGYLTVPRDKSKKVPGLLILPSSGVHGLTPPQYPKGDRAAMAININFWDVDLPKEAYEWQTWPAPYLVTGILTRETYSLRFGYAALVRAAQLLAARPEVQADHILVYGSSQGGGLALVAAGLQPDRFKGVVANVPGLCRIDQYLDRHPPYFPIAWSDETRPRIEETLRYYDAIHFARRIRCPVWMAVGLRDDTTPAQPAIAAYNAVPAEFRKQLTVRPDAGHTGLIGPEAAAAVWDKTP